MTSTTSSELQVVYFALIFMALLGVFTYLYSSDPITDVSYGGNTTFTNQTTSSDDEKSTWIGDIISALPAPFDTPLVAIIGGIFVIPITVMLTYISIRAIKDLVSGWI